MVVVQKGIENLEVKYIVDIHSMEGECIDNCILLQIGDKLILRFNRLNEIKGIIENVKHSNINFDSADEEEAFKERVKKVIEDIQIKYELLDGMDF